MWYILSLELQFFSLFFSDFFRLSRALTSLTWVFPFPPHFDITYAVHVVAFYFGSNVFCRLPPPTLLPYLVRFKASSCRANKSRLGPMRRRCPLLARSPLTCFALYVARSRETGTKGKTKAKQWQQAEEAAKGGDRERERAGREAALLAKQKARKEGSNKNRKKRIKTQNKSKTQKHVVCGWKTKPNRQSGRKAGQASERARERERKMTMGRSGNVAADLN